VYRTFFPDTQGGTEEVIRTLAMGLPREHFEVMVLFPSRLVTEVEESAWGGVRICRVPELFEIASCNVFLRGLGAYRHWAAWADVVHYHFPWPFADLLHLCALPQPRSRSVLTYHADIVRQRFLGWLYAPLMRRFLGSVDRIVATSEAYAQSSPVLASLQQPIDVIPLGIDAARLPVQRPERLAHWRERCGQNFFLFVGVLRYYKGLDVLLHAVAGTALHVVIVGDGPQGPRLRDLAARLGAANVLFTGRVDDADKYALLALSRAFVFPSNRRAEAYGVALLEAMSFARPLLTCYIGTGVNFVNVPGETGLSVAPDDPLALRGAMERLAADDALCARLGRGARERVESVLAAKTMVQAYANLYESVCAPSPVGRERQDAAS
jgi:rhamnosyl/mannosyltransferase